MQKKRNVSRYPWECSPSLTRNEEVSVLITIYASFVSLKTGRHMQIKGLFD